MNIINDENIINELKEIAKNNVPEKIYNDLLINNLTNNNS